MVVIPSKVARSPDDFYKAVASEKVTVLNQTASTFNLFIREDHEQNLRLSLRYIIFGGEALNYSNLLPWVDKHGFDAPNLINMYGITETTVHVTYQPIERHHLQGKSHTSLIGEPLLDLCVYVLDSAVSYTHLTLPTICSV